MRLLSGASESDTRRSTLPWVGVREPSPAQGMNDLPNCGCQILDGDLRTLWMRRKLLSCRTMQSQLSNGLRESFSHASSGASVGSIIQRLLEAMVALAAVYGGQVSQDMDSRHSVVRPADGLPEACESHSERADPVGRLTRLLTSLVTVAHQQQPFSPGQGLGKRAPRGK
jgi:hypothetical protein